MTATASPTDLATRARAVFAALVTLLNDAERERDRIASDAARLPPWGSYSAKTQTAAPYVPTAVVLTAVRLITRCTAMRRTLVTLERGMRSPERCRVAQSNPTTAALNWQVLQAARAALALEPAPTPPAEWAARVSELRALIRDTHTAALSHTAWP